MRHPASLICGVLLLVACGPKYDYPESARQFVNENCDLQFEECSCGWELVQERVPYEDWKAFYLDQPTQEVHGPNRRRGIEATPEWERLNKLFNDINQECQDV